MASTFPSVPPSLANQLRAAYDALPPPGRARWRNPEARVFARTLAAAKKSYGGPNLARATGIPKSNIYNICDRADRLSREEPMPSDTEMRRVRKAYAEICQLRASGRHVHRANLAYVAMQDALAELLDRTDLK